jgi:hypothetical protein
MTTVCHLSPLPVKKKYLSQKPWFSIESNHFGGPFSGRTDFLRGDESLLDDHAREF